MIANHLALRSKLSVCSTQAGIYARKGRIPDNEWDGGCYTLNHTSYTDPAARDHADQ